jgi:hypothetical protein
MLNNPAILPENVYNINEIRIRLSVLTSRKYIVNKNNVKSVKGPKINCI